MTATDHNRERERMIEAGVRQWLEETVIGLGLCPFARQPVDAGRLRIVISTACDEESLLHELHGELKRLDQQPEHELETTLIAVPELLQDFYDYNDFLDLGDALLEQFGWVGRYQIASFHPLYQFAGTEPEDAENYSNRSPWPLLHLLREDSVERAVAAYPDTDKIPIRNTQLMQEMGVDALRRRLAAYAQGPQAGK